MAKIRGDRTDAPRGGDEFEWNRIYRTWRIVELPSDPDLPQLGRQ